MGQLVLAVLRKCLKLPIPITCSGCLQWLWDPKSRQKKKKNSAITNWAINSVAVKSGKCSEDLILQDLGPLSHSKWLTMAIRELRMYLSEVNPLSVPNNRSCYTYFEVIHATMVQC